MLKLALLAVTAACLFTTPLFANEFAAPLQAQAEAAKAWLGDAIIIDSLKAQNTAHGNLTQADIDTLDKQWRAETTAADQPLIQKVLGNPLSAYLKQKQAASNGLYAEIFVMDSKGLNAGQSAITSDYWQGDEDKWLKTFSAGANAIHLGDVEQDESTQAFQSQLSLPIVDPASGAVIGAITIGINVEAL